MLFGAFRLDQYSDPESFMAQCAILLSEYPECVVNYVTDVRTGIQRRQTFPPSMGEIAKACDERMEWLQKQSDHEQYLARKAEAMRAPKKATPTETQKPGQMTYSQFLERFPNERPRGRFEVIGTF